MHYPFPIPNIEQINLTNISLPSIQQQSWPAQPAKETFQIPLRHNKQSHNCRPHASIPNKNKPPKLSPPPSPKSAASKPQTKLSNKTTPISRPNTLFFASSTTSWKRTTIAPSRTRIPSRERTMFSEPVSAFYINEN